MNDRLVNVVIPVYKNSLTDLELVSLRQCCGVLKKYRITVVHPEGLDTGWLKRDFPNLSFESFDPGYFKGISGYNRLMMSRDFYARFVDYEYILIHQLDAYVFSDSLDEWCHKGFDYIGGPWLVRPIYSFPLLRFTSWLKKNYCNIFGVPNSQITNWKVGNGGLSLRKVESHLKAVDTLGGVIEDYLSHPGNHIFNEDVFFSVEVNRHGLGFTYPDWREALKFSFDKYPAWCYQLNGERLPFGCHSWYKRRMKKFWFPVILSGKKP